ncbi:hypothetical protein D3C87_1333350 [compost metagenome]
MGHRNRKIKGDIGVTVVSRHVDTDRFHVVEREIVPVGSIGGHLCGRAQEPAAETAFHRASADADEGDPCVAKACNETPAKHDKGPAEPLFLKIIEDAGPRYDHQVSLVETKEGTDQ